ncbi:hypothetical protein AGR2A_Cc100059 [Agrobacterium genomosp. 2 str. CFBP 5494]|uniref:Uncharacterized protein n=1 Tax=Agrobacterium genomosp. 2 str. CFBP 5494 TaxID=1183436 RepID=A0A9W5AXS9_9HYPH|nr:hypothetical protein AGR2A_Cc100059 [Agrobacterium genomosp. 2 str. CFBP 5494]
MVGNKELLPGYPTLIIADAAYPISHTGQRHGGDALRRVSPGLAVHRKTQAITAALSVSIRMAIGCHALSALPAEQAAVDFALTELEVDIRYRAAEIFEFAFLGGLATNGASDLAKRSKHDFRSFRFGTGVSHRCSSTGTPRFLLFNF